MSRMAFSKMLIKEEKSFAPHMSIEYVWSLVNTVLFGVLKKTVCLQMFVKVVFNRLAEGDTI